MNNTQKITISLDINKTIDSVAAQCHVLALSSVEDFFVADITPEIVKDSWVSLAIDLVSLVSGEVVITDELMSMTLEVSGNSTVTAQQLRMMAEKYVCADVIAEMYAGSKSVRETYSLWRDVARNNLLRAICPMDIKPYRF